MKALVQVILVLFFVILSITVGRIMIVEDATAGVRKNAPTTITLLASSPESLFVAAAFTPGTVTNPSEPVLNDLDWLRNSILVDSMRATQQTEDTLRIGRAPLGGTDTIRVEVKSSYQGRFGPTAVAIAVFDNPDLQVPTQPIIITVDTTCAGQSTCP